LFTINIFYSGTNNKQGKQINNYDDYKYYDYKHYDTIFRKFIKNR